MQQDEEEDQKWRVHGPEKDRNKRIERQTKGSRGLEAYCKGGQGPPRAVAPAKKKKNFYFYYYYYYAYYFMFNSYFRRTWY